MSSWTPERVTKMLLRLGSFAVIAYLLISGNTATNDIIAISGVLSALGASLIPEPASST